MIRVAYDVSFAAPAPGKPAMITGVGRVIEELFKCLRVNPDLDLRVVGGFARGLEPDDNEPRGSGKWASTVVKLPTPSLAGYRTRSRLGELAAKALYQFQERVNRSRQLEEVRALQRAKMLPSLF